MGPVIRQLRRPREPRSTGLLRAGALVCTAGLVALTAGPAAADTLLLPRPGEAQDPALCRVVGCLPDRLLHSVVPGPVTSQEIVRVALGGDGTVTTVTLEQRLVLTGRGDYQIRERGPARSARSLSDLDPPITKFGAVVWQGFSPGDRELAAELTLDAALEAARLPLAVAVSFRPAGGGPAQPLAAGGRFPGGGTVTVTVRNQTALASTALPTASDADPKLIGLLLDGLLRRSQAAPGPRLPAVGALQPGALLPARLTVTGLGSSLQEVQVPLRVTGTLAVTGTTAVASGPGVTATPEGGAVRGTLSGEVELALAVAGPGRLALDLQVIPVLDPRTLAPPGGATSWARWAASAPPQAERVAALHALVSAAAVGARAASYSPYLGADLPGSGTTTFHYGFGPEPRQVRTVALQAPRPVALALAGVALALLLGNAVLLWRRS